MTKQFSNYSDLLTYTRASKGHALRPVSYGDELVTNGTFDTDTTGWEGQDSNISVTSVDGEAKVTASSASSYIFDSFPTKVGGIYKITADGRLGSNVTALNFNIRNNSSTGPYVTASPQLTADGTLEFVFVAEATTTAIRLVMFKSTNPAVAYWDNVSVKEVLFDQPDGTLTLFEHPNNVPRVEYDADGNRLGLLVEEARTNLVTYSEDFSQSSWSKIRCSVSEGSITAPDGTASAFIVTPATGLNTHYIADIVSGTSGSRTISFFAKKKEYSIVFVGHGIGAQEGTYFDLDAGTITSEGTDIDSSAITPLLNGWYRCAITFDSVIDPRYAILAPCESSGSTSFNPDGSSGVYVWGAQFETGSFPTSYIKSNSGSTTTRSADVASIPVADFGYNQSAGTLFAEYKRFGSGNAWIAYLGESSNTYISLGNGNSGTAVRMQVAESGTSQASLDTATVSTGTVYKQAGAFKANDFSATENGNAVHTDTSGTLPDGITFLDIGEQYGNYLNGHIKKLMYIPRRVTNAQLISLTE